MDEILPASALMPLLNVINTCLLFRVLNIEYETPHFVLHVGQNERRLVAKRREDLEVNEISGEIIFAVVYFLH